MALWTDVEDAAAAAVGGAAGGAAAAIIPVELGTTGAVTDAYLSGDLDIAVSLLALIAEGWAFSVEGARGGGGGGGGGTGLDASGRGE